MLTMKISYISHPILNLNLFHVIWACKGTSLKGIFDNIWCNLSFEIIGSNPTDAIQRVEWEAEQ